MRSDNRTEKMAKKRSGVKTLSAEIYIVYHDMYRVIFCVAYRLF